MQSSESPSCCPRLLHTLNAESPLLICWPATLFLKSHVWAGVGAGAGVGVGGVGAGAGVGAGGDGAGGVGAGGAGVGGQLQRGNS